MRTSGGSRSRELGGAMNESNPSPDLPPEEPVPTPAHPWNFTEDYPVLTVLGAFVVGLALGCAIPHESSRKRRFYEEPLDEVKDLLHGLLSTAQKQATKAVDVAESKTTDVIDSVKSKLKRCW